MADKPSKFERLLGSAKLSEGQLDPFRQIVAQLPNNWTDTRGFDLAAGMALRVKSGSPAFAPIARLFKVANLDHEIPWHWPILLVLIAWCSSEESRGPGAKTKWTSKKLNELRSDLATLKSTKNKSLMAKHLRKKFPNKYGRLKDSYLRKVVRRALLAKTLASLLATPHTAPNQKIVTADVTNDIVTAIKNEIESENAVLKFVKDRPLDFQWTSLNRFLFPGNL
jgi:hypothetical protein